MNEESKINKNKYYQNILQFQLIYYFYIEIVIFTII